MKEILIVSIGSFFGGGMRYWISKMVQSYTVIAFPFGTMAVNVAGCLIIGFLSGLNWREGGWMSPSAKLLLTTGFCGGFTTFSTFMNEGAGLMKEENYLYMMLYLFGSLALGLIAVLAGHDLAKMIALEEEGEYKKKPQIAEKYTEDSIPSNEETMKILSFLLFYISKMP